MIMANGQDRLDNIGQWLHQGRFRPHANRLPQVQRHDLLRRLARPRPGVSTLVIAPAGWGKSTLLAQWREVLRKSGHKASWLAVDMELSDPHRFFSCLILSLAQAGVAMGPLEQLADQGLPDTSPEAAVRAIITRLEQLSEPLAIMIDDYHKASGRVTDRMLERLLNEAPESVSVVLGARSRPDIRYTDLKLKGRIQEISVPELGFSLAEARALFPATTAEQDLAQLLAHAEGWAIVLQLMCSLLQGGASVAGVVARLEDETGDMADYFTRQLCEELPAPARDLLQQTSIVEQFNADLANHLTGRHDCGAMLEDLAHRQLLVVAAGQGAARYRCHRLFAQFLRKTLLHTGPESLPALYNRAAEWYAGHDLPAPASKYACLTGNIEYAARIIGQSGGWELILFNGVSHFRKFISHFPEREYVRFPEVAVARIYQYMREGEVCRAHQLFLELKEYHAGLPAADDDDSARLRRGLVLVGMMLDIYEDRMDLAAQRGLPEVSALEGKLTPSDSAGHALVQVSAAVVCLSSGRFRQAIDYARTSRRLMREANCNIVLNYTLVHQGQASLFLGNLGEALANFEEAQDITVENTGVAGNLKAVTEVLIAAARYFHDEVDSAQLRAALKFLEHCDCWFDIYAAGYGVAANLAFEQQGPDAAVAVLNAGRRLADARGLDRLAALLDAFEYLFLARMKEVRRARAFAEQKIPPAAARVSGSNWRHDHLAGMADGLLALQTGDLEAARVACRDLMARADALEHYWHRLDALILQALTLAGEGRDQEALETLLGALEQAALKVDCRPLRPLLVFGAPLKSLLFRLWRARNRLALDSLTCRFIINCLAVFGNESAAPQHGPGRLSKRELEVLSELALGLSNKEIARALDMTDHTVKFHLKNIFAKLKARNRVMAVAAGRREGLVV